MIEKILSSKKNAEAFVKIIKKNFGKVLKVEPHQEYILHKQTKNLQKFYQHHLVQFEFFRDHLHQLFLPKVYYRNQGQVLLRVLEIFYYIFFQLSLIKFLLLRLISKYVHSK